MTINELESDPFVRAMSNLTEDVLEIIRSELNIDHNLGSEHYGLSLMRDLDANQGDLAQIGFRLEQHFGLTGLAEKSGVQHMEPAQMASLITVRTVLVFVVQQVSQKNRGS